MRLVISWLRDWVDIAASPQEIADRMALRGFEVASVEPLPNHPAYPDQPEAVIDFEVTANRPDCLSVMGLAREVATAFDVPFAPTHVTHGADVPTGTNERLTIAIDDERLGPRYVGAVMDVRPVATPEWIARRLQAAGVRPISAIVDITNYVMIERGQPMHAFDYARLGGAAIHVRRARSGERITTLDNVARSLDAEMLVIADRDRAQAVAGVMGGLDSEVSASTTTIVLESAYFQAASVRKTSKRLGLHTEASARFERGADVNGALAAMQRAIALIDFLKAGTISGPIVDVYPRPQEPKHVHLRRDRLARLLGASVPDAEVVRILRALGLEVTPAADGWDTVAPTFRVDLLREADLIEEVGRHYGLDKLASTFPPVVAAAPPPDPRIPRDRLVRRVLTSAGYSEAVTFGFIEAKAAEDFQNKPQSSQSSQNTDLSAGSAVSPVFSERVGIANPLSGKFDTLRPSLLPGLVDAVGHNRRHGRRDVQLFEIGTRFSAGGETRGVAIATTGAAGTEHWSGGAREVDFFDVKGAIEHLCDGLGVAVRFEPVREPFLVPGQTAAIIVAGGAEDGVRIGAAGQLAPALADARGLPRQDRVWVAEVDLDRLQRARGTISDATQPLPRYPFVVRDLSIVVADTLPAEIIRGTILSAGRNLPAPLIAMSFFDRYQGKGVPAGAVSLSVRVTFQAADRTLTDAEVQQSVETILAALVEKHGAVQR
jgi:phenylalanyl-tRNA synthetase beta chain